MVKNWDYKSGDWWIICDVCSRKIKASIAKQRWDGFIVCPEDYEHRHPQDFLKSRSDKIIVPFTRPQGTDQFITITYVTSYVVATYTEDDGNYFLDADI